MAESAVRQETGCEQAEFAALRKLMASDSFPSEERRLYDAAIEITKRLKAAQIDISDIVRDYLFESGAANLRS